MHATTLRLLTIPLFTAVIGYLTNWSGVVMLFYPVAYRGVRLPGLAGAVGLLPRKIQQIPGVMQGGVGWQGIIPSRAAKMGSIAVDKGIAKLGSPAEFYQQLEPEKLAEHIVEASRGDIRALVERIMEREQPQLWQSMPARVRAAVHARVQQQLPDNVHDVTEEIGANIDQLLDVKLMVIRTIEERPELANRIFLDVGRRELRLVQNLGFVFGFVLGIPLAFLTQAVPWWWITPLGGVAIGYLTNLAAIAMIFEPVQPRRLGPLRLQGLFIKRQPEVAEVYAKIIADDIVTLSRIGEELLHGPSSDRTRQMIETALRPALDRAVGFARPLVRLTVGSREYEAIRTSVAHEAVDFTMGPLTDAEFNRQQSGRIRRLIADRMVELPAPDFAEMLRSAIREDEWLLYLHGAVLGFGAGLLHLAIFG